MRRSRPLPVLLLAFALLHSCSVSAQEADSSGAGRQRRLSIIPVLFYTPDTELGGGVVPFVVLSDSAGAGRSSLLAGTGFYTQKRQTSLTLSADLELSGGAHRAAGLVAWRKFPDSFFGVGPRSSAEDEEIYTPRVAEMEASFQRRVLPGIRPGIRYEFRRTRMAELEEDGALIGGGAPGSDGGTSAGLGPVLAWDTRNSTIYPMRGRLWRVEAIGFGRAWGSDYSFSRHLVDLREYVPSGGGRVVALRAFAVENRGLVPFDRMATIGGEALLRGYGGGRYRDRSAAVLVAELRTPIWRRFGGVLFAGAGDVADRLEDLQPRRFRHSVGAGLRFALDPKERLNIRADLGFGAGSSGFYIGGTEVF